MILHNQKSYYISIWFSRENQPTTRRSIIIFVPRRYIGILRFVSSTNCTENLLNASETPRGAIPAGDRTLRGGSNRECGWFTGNVGTRIKWLLRFVVLRWLIFKLSPTYIVVRVTFSRIQRVTKMFATIAVNAWFYDSITYAANYLDKHTPRGCFHPSDKFHYRNKELYLISITTFQIFRNFRVADPSPDKTREPKNRRRVPSRAPLHLYARRPSAWQSHERRVNKGTSPSLSNCAHKFVACSRSPPFRPRSDPKQIQRKPAEHEFLEATIIVTFHCRRCPWVPWSRNTRGLRGWSSLCPRSRIHAGR